MRLRLSRHTHAPQGRTSSIGQAVVEFGLVLPLLLVIFAGAADFGRLFYGYVAIENAVKEGALYGSRYPVCADSSALCQDPDNVRWRVQEEAKTVRNPDGTKITPTSRCLSASTGAPRPDLRDCVAGDTYEVAASYRLKLITPILGAIIGSGVTVESRSTAVVLNRAFDPTAGAAPTKFVRAADARNSAELRAKCEQPDPTASPDFYRSPCVDTTAPGGTTLVSAVYRPNDTIVYRIVVRNNGGTNLTGVTIDDSLGWPASCPARPTTMAVNGTPYSCTYSRVAPNVSGTGDASDHQNILTVTATEIAPTTDRATVTIERPPPDLRVLKYVSPYKEGADGDGWIGGVATFGTIQALDVYRISGSVPVWYKIIVTNQGGRTATDVQITDSNRALPYGQNNSSAVCDAAPGNLVAGGRFECRYMATYDSNETVLNSVTARASNVTPDANDDNSATVTVASCGGGNRVVPNLIGITKAAAQTAWTDAGFTGTLTSWSGSPNPDATVAQSRQAFSCMAPATTITVSRTNT